MLQDVKNIFNQIMLDNQQLNRHILDLLHPTNLCRNSIKITKIINNFNKKTIKINNFKKKKLLLISPSHRYKNQNHTKDLHHLLIRTIKCNFKKKKVRLIKQKNYNFKKKKLLLLINHKINYNFKKKKFLPISHRYKNQLGMIHNKEVTLQDLKLQNLEIKIATSRSNNSSQMKSYMGQTELQIKLHKKLIFKRKKVAKLSKKKLVRMWRMANPMYKKITKILNKNIKNIRNYKRN